MRTKAKSVLQIEAKQPSGRLVAHVVSDIHLSTSASGITSGNNFLHFLEELNRKRTTEEESLLILNGDVFDITGSWHLETLPWDPDFYKVEGALLLVLEL